MPKITCPKCNGQGAYYLPCTPLIGVSGIDKYPPPQIVTCCQCKGAKTIDVPDSNKPPPPLFDGRDPSNFLG